MAETGLIMSYLLALAVGNAEDQLELQHYAEPADVSLDDLVAELTQEPDVYALVEQQKLGEELYPLATRTARVFRDGLQFGELMTGLGNRGMQEVGNLYTASLPAWMAAGLEEAATQGTQLAGTRILTMGYGSGDAAEAIPMRVVKGWEAAARKIGFQQALGTPEDLDEAGYQALHDGTAFPETSPPQPGVFYIDHIGQREERFDDSGIEYYRYQS